MLRNKVNSCVLKSYKAVNRPQTGKANGMRNPDFGQASGFWHPSINEKVKRVPRESRAE